MGELRGINPHKVDALQIFDLQNKALDWRLDPSPIVAGELITAALFAAQPERATEAAAAVARAESPGMFLETLARRDLDLVSPSDKTRMEVHQLNEQEQFRQGAMLKRRLVLDPRDALAWCDLALHYSKLDQRDNALDAMQKALWLAPTNRFVLRSAARLYVHIGQPERAHRLLIPFGHAGNDPWLLAAELAVASASRRTPRSVKNGRRLLGSGHISAFNGTELASALGTIELADGETKRAKRLFGQALQDPTENSLAQVEWAAKRLDGLRIHEKTMNAPNAHEARARMFYERRMWKEAADESWQWLVDQPFSSQPAAFGSCIAEMALRDFRRAAAFAKLGLHANKHNATLLNNLAVAQIGAGEVSEARKTLGVIPAPPMDDAIGVTWQATLGLVEFREGNRSAGRFHYEAAIDAARRRGLNERVAMATVMLAREEWRIDGLAALPFVVRAFESVKRNPDALVELSLSLLRAEVESVGVSRPSNSPAS